MRRRLGLLLVAALLPLGVAAIQPTCTPWRYDSSQDADPAYWQQWDAHAGWTGHAGDPAEELFPPGCTP